MAARTLLVVDDEPDIRQSIAAFVHASVPDVRVLTAASGEEALRLFEREAVDIVLSDYKMPGMDGLELLTRLARRHPAVPRVMFTAFASPDLAARATKEAGVALLIAKPFDLAYFIEVVRALLARAPSA